MSQQLYKALHHMFASTVLKQVFFQAKMPNISCFQFLKCEGFAAAVCVNDIKNNSLWVDQTKLDI